MWVVGSRVGWHECKKAWLSFPRPSPPVLSYYNGSLEKRGPSLVLSTSCSAHFKPLQTPTEHHLPQIGAAPLQVLYLFSWLSRRRVQPGVWGGVSHCIEKAELLMHASRVLTLPSHCVFLGVFKAPHSDPPSPSAAQRRSCARWRARRPIVLLHKRETADFWKNSHIQAKLSSPPPPAISPVCG